MLTLCINKARLIGRSEVQLSTAVVCRCLDSALCHFNHNIFKSVKTRLADTQEIDHCRKSGLIGRQLPTTDKLYLMRSWQSASEDGASNGSGPQDDVGYDGALGRLGTPDDVGYDRALGRLGTPDDVGYDGALGRLGTPDDVGYDGAL